MENKELAKQNPVEQCALLAKEGQLYNAYIPWFRLPDEQRQDALRDTIVRNVELQESLRDIKDDIKNGVSKLSPVDQFILGNFEILSSDAAKKILLPEEVSSASEEDLEALGGDGEQAAAMRFDKILYKDREYGRFDYSSDYLDFTHTDRIIRSRFSLEDKRQFLLRILPLVLESQAYREFGIINSLTTFIHPIKDTELVFDETLGPYLKEELMGQFRTFEPNLANYLNQEVFPSARFFEEVFKRRTEDSDPKGFFVVDADEGGKSVPKSLYYFTLLRRINQTLEKTPPQKVHDIKNKVVEYLFSDEFMKRALSYLETDEAYGHKSFEDEFIQREIHAIYYKIDIEARGEEAKMIKRQKFSEVLKAALEHLEAKGETDNIQKLKEREVTGVKFADYLGG